MIIKIREVIGTSEKSFEDALNNAVHHELMHQKKITGAKVVSQSAEVKDGKITLYKVGAKLAYIWEEA
ncbi:MAG: dodecin domain-containing protein [Candidatus Portnoybacteria bacterium CG10_big_fil_rev_8_21_14_0_10_36_7]|uniref:Dodecin domain-containing protein n=1 Tax=Candidatus Portnoybacteria bacterium CG10_big_fil_rev_8_21_14_0_10_36_7 TaxID=1974812 RepID=A0A2M8KD92_9BACT|nr:MAG: dodecin domain-containing protein [Candidatus Portnoybacteria bacterium CG10_big_fil_rev_8_21_14_0_10_36_7]